MCVCVCVGSRLDSAGAGCSEASQNGTASASRFCLAVHETVILLHPPPPLVGVSIVMGRGVQQNDSLADG